MMLNHEPATGNGHDQRRDEGGFRLPPRAHLYDYLIVLARYRWLLAAVIVVATGLLIAYAMVAPHVFTANAVLLPPDKSSSVGFGELLKEGAGLDFQGLSENSSAEQFVQILRSRTLTDSVIRRFDFIGRYGLAPDQHQIARDIFQGSLNVSSDRNGIIQLQYSEGTGYNPSKAQEDTAAAFAARVLNASVDVLDYINRTKLVTHARRTREYLGRMADEKRRERDSIERVMLAFEQQNKAVALDEQIDAAVGALAAAETEINKKEVELASLQAELAPDAAQVGLVRRELAELRDQKARLERGEGTGSSIGVDLRNLPSIARQYANLKLDMKVATEVYTYLEAQYHQQQVQEARDLPTVSVLDSAVVPEIRTAPRRRLMVVVGIPVIVAASVVLVFLLELVRRELRGAPGEKSAALRAAFGRRRLPEATE